jgi:8-oxo-dGTP pyrophosphatase MutT (NUDIX family)
VTDVADPHPLRGEQQAGGSQAMVNLPIDAAAFCERGLRERMAQFQPLEVASADDLRPAAVGIVLGYWASALPLCFLLIQRSSALASHAGQYGLPGGKVQQGESFEQALIREANEEIGLDIGTQHIIGRMDDYSTRSGYSIRPFVVWYGAGLLPTPDPGEVACLLHIPVSALTGPAIPTLLTYPGAEKPVIQLPLGGERVIHAPTGAILFQFGQWVIRGTRVRSDAYSEPSFAWK